MVCNRCILAVENILRQLHLPYHEIQVGEIHLDHIFDEVQRIQLQEALQAIGLELMDNRLNQWKTQKKNS